MQVSKPRPLEKACVYLHSICIPISFPMYTFAYFRIYLAALHLNENSNREQATDKEGRPAFSVSFPRAKQTTGGYTVRKVLTKATHSKYINK